MLAFNHVVYSRGGVEVRRDKSMSNASDRRFFSDIRFTTPFGRYSSDNESEPPANEILVGREGQRAFFINLLTNVGRRGAFLVTGRRGVGKTTFVLHCVKEYGDAVFKRFLRGSVGRSAFDRLAVSIFFLLVVLAELIASEFLQFLINSPDRGLRWLLIVPAIIVCVIPFLYATHLMGAVLDCGESRRWSRTLGAILLVLLVSVGAWYTGSFAKPALSISGLFAGICIICFVTYACSYSQPPRGPDSKARRAALENFNNELAVFHRFVGVITVIAVLIGINPLLAVAREQTPQEFFWNIGVGLWALGLGVIARAISHGVISTAFTNLNVPRTALRGTSNSYWFIGLVLLGVAPFFFLSIETNAITYLTLGTPALVLLVARRWQIERTSAEGLAPVFRPRPWLILAAKAVVCVVVALQLAHPVLSKIPGVARNVQAFPHSLSTVAVKHEMLFQSVPGDFVWMFGLLAIILLIYFIEYEWVIRPYVRVRDERTLVSGEPPEWEDREGRFIPPTERSSYQRMATLTFPWFSHRMWLPTLVVHVNLGFNRLDHRRIIQAMLTGLRDEYQKMYVSWNSAIANVGRFVGLMLLVWMVTSIGRAWFDIPPSANKGSQPPIATVLLNIGDCSVPCMEPQSSLLISTLYFELLPVHSLKTSGTDKPLVTKFLHYNSSWSVGHPEIRSLSLRVYHLVLAVLLFAFWRWLIRRLPILPYYWMLQRMNDHLDNLSAHTSVQTRKTLWKPAVWIHGRFADEEVRGTERDPVDPRTVELAFLDILTEIQRATIGLPGLPHISLSAPEITFVFDELDKLGTRIDPQHASTLGPEQDADVLYTERHRSLALHRLLSDLKNVLSASPARFVFVGGRNMHDEWLADQTARQPLLTSIFNAEIYIPSLLTDGDPKHMSPQFQSTGEHATEKEGARTIVWDHRVQEYMDRQFYRVHVQYINWVQNRLRPAIALGVAERVPETFVQPQDKLSEKFSQYRDGDAGREAFAWHPKQLLDSEHGRPIGAEAADTVAKTFYEDFVRFLAYRSTGNPKKLKELLSTFVRPMPRAVGEGKIRWEHFAGLDVLEFDDKDIFRIQLVSSIYQHLALGFEQRMSKRDDKVVVALFYLTDFLLKFHRRAFAWENLEHIDELVHIHHAPDLREILERLVDHCSERFLHRVLNGIYAYRFRSDLAHEIEYISRQSAEEMAAFNFTLDESQALKALYRETLKGAGKDNPDVVAALGELHEFEQEYEAARQYYRQAIWIADSYIKSIIGQDAKIGDLLEGDWKTLENARLFMPWGITRLRLMLQVGMTFEQTRNFERAEIAYRNARNLSNALITAYLGNPEDRRDEDAESTRDDDERMYNLTRPSRRWQALKDISLLYQPMFAEAWVAEKLPGSVDTSGSLVERELWRLRRALPYISDPKLELHSTPAKVRGSNFGLIASQLHKKAGDLYFFKGKQASTVERLQTTHTHEGSEGYLPRAHYHYCVDLHELRRFIHHRRWSSRMKLAIGEEEPRRETITTGNWPDFVSRAVAGSVNDLAEVVLSLVSFFELLRNIHEADNLERIEKSSESKFDLASLVGDWLEADFGDEAEDSKAQTKRLDIRLDTETIVSLGTLQEWFGTWFTKEGERLPKTYADLLTLRRSHASEHRLAFSLNLCLAGSKYVEQAGYPEDAARELLRVCDTVTHYLWWLSGSRKLVEWTSGTDTDLINTLSDCTDMSTSKGRAYWCYLIDMALQAFEKVDELFRQCREDDRMLSGGESSNSAVVPRIALTSLCSLGLAMQHGFDEQRDKELRKRLHLQVRKWSRELEGETQRSTKPETGELNKINVAWLRGILQRSLVRFRFPMMNRLNGLKVLLDDKILFGKKNDDDKERDWMRMAIPWADELLDLSAKFDAPLHFTPLHPGLSCAFMWLRLKHDGMGEMNKREQLKVREHFRRAALRNLRASEQMYTKRRAFYRSISGLYYLYDDFNDRYIHYNHAIQMTCSDLVSLLIHELSSRDENPRTSGTLS